MLDVAGTVKIASRLITAKTATVVIGWLDEAPKTREWFVHEITGA